MGIVVRSFRLFYHHPLGTIAKSPFPRLALPGGVEKVALEGQIVTGGELLAWSLACITWTVVPDEVFGVFAGLESSVLILWYVCNLDERYFRS
jgi:hypothetical protein